MIKDFLINRMNKAFDDNQEYLTNLISDYIGDNSNLKILDVGCSSGDMTKKILGTYIKSNDVYGLDFEKKKIKDIKYSSANLETEKFPYKDETFDIVFSNQVIEHLLNKDNMLKESYRVLKKGGLFIVSTENISSFDNILSLVLGQEPLCQHTSSKKHTQSFLSPSFMQDLEGSQGNLLGHKNVCSYFGLQRLMKLHGFKNISIKSFGNFIDILEVIFPIYNRIIICSSIK